MSSRSRRKRTGGRNAKRAARQRSSVAEIPYIDRKIPCYELLDDAALELIEYNADTVLEEIGIDFKEFPEALDLFRAAH